MTPPHLAPIDLPLQATVLVHSIFDRILSMLPSKAVVEDNSITAVEKALARIELAAQQAPTVQLPQPTSPLYLCNTEHHATQRFNEISEPTLEPNPCCNLRSRDLLQPQADMDIVTSPTTSALFHQLDAAATTQAWEEPNTITGPSVSPTTEAPANTCLHFCPSCVYHRRARDAPAGMDIVAPAPPQPVMEAEAVSFMDSLLQVQEQPLL